MIGRPQLVAALDRAAARKVTIISAPAGSGKTALLRAWADRPGQPYRVSFVPVRGPALVDRLRSALEAEHRPVMLVLDDLHELDSPDALDQLTELLLRLPPHAHAMLATRHDLRLGLHQLRLAGELAEIRAAQLQLTAAETRELLAEAGIALPDAVLTQLHQRTDGWATGVRLAAIGLATQADPARFVAEFSGSDRTVAEYLLAEVLDRQPAHVKDLLLRTAVLDRVNGALGDLLTGHGGAEQVLLELEDANAFVRSVDPDRTWFRYHHLFGGLLRLELRRTRPDEIPELHRRAARWLADRGHAADAIGHLQAAGDWAEAAQLLADHSFGLSLDGQAETIHALLRAFPQGSACGVAPELALAHATDDLAAGRLAEAAARLAVARAQVASADPHRQHRVRVTIASLDLLLARQRGNFADIIEQVNLLAPPMTGQSNADVTLGRDLRAQALLNLGTAEAWSLRLADSAKHLTEGAALARDIGRPYLEVACLAQLGFAVVADSFAAARQRCTEAIELAGQHGWDSEPVIVPALATLAGLCTWTGEFDQARQWLRRAEAGVDDTVEPAVRLLLRLIAGMWHAGRGDQRAALAEFEAAATVQAGLVGEPALAPQVTGWLVATRARLGLLAPARAALAARTDEQARHGELRNAVAVLRLAEGDPDGARRALAGVRTGSVPVIHAFTLVETHLLEALAARALGDQRAANAAVERALGVAEPDRLILPFAMTGTADLLADLPLADTAHAALLADIRDGAPTSGGSAPPSDELSRSELRVLRYLPTNLTRPEIASRLSVSLNTVNTHIRNIYAKLGARDRSTAVARARELRLVAAGRAG